MAAEPLSQQAVAKEIARRAQVEIDRRRQRDPDGFRRAVEKAIRGELFARQIAVLDDPCRRISFCCSRRSGKTEWAVRALALSMENSGEEEFTVFGARTLGVARDLVWRRLLRLGERYGLNWKVNEARAEISTQGGGEFRLFGVDDAVSIEKVRGKKYRLVICDEASTYEGNLQKLIQECFSPGTMDFDPPGRIVICGTPGYVCKGFWFDIAGRPISDGGSKAFSRHHWTLRDNPHIPNVDAAIAEECEAWGWTDTDPAKLRELDGRWISDESALVYAYDPKRNSCTELPEPFDPERWLTTLAADIGYTDDFAITVIGSPPHSKDMFILYAFKQSGMLVGAQADMIQKTRQRFKPTKVVVDAGGQGKLTLEEFNARYGSAAGGRASAAEKSGKVEAIGMLNSDLRRGALKVYMPDGEPWASEAMHLPWASDDKNKEHPGFANHACFVAGTLITTQRGQVPIESIQPGDLALTRGGFRPVVDAWCSGLRETYKVESASGLSVEATADHPLWSGGRWVLIKDLQEGDELTCLVSKQSTGTVRSTEGIQTEHRAPTESTTCAQSKAAASCTCTGRCGNSTTGPSLPVTRSTTSTETQPTTSPRTSPACRRLTTSAATGTKSAAPPRDESSCRTSSQQRAAGTPRLKATLGTAQTASAHGNSARSCLASARSASVPSSPKSQLHPCAPEPVEPRTGATLDWMMSTGAASGAEEASEQTSTAARSVVLSAVRRISRTGRVEPVFNITVEEHHEFFANDILAKNCDCGLYAWRRHRAWLAKPAPKEKTAEDVEQERIAARAKRVLLANRSGRRF